jgi:hypothetical protein
MVQLEDFKQLETDYFLKLQEIEVLKTGLMEFLVNPVIPLNIRWEFYIKDRLGETHWIEDIYKHLPNWILSELERYENGGFAVIIDIIPNETVYNKTEIADFKEICLKHRIFTINISW